MKNKCLKLIEKELKNLEDARFEMERFDKEFNLNKFSLFQRIVFGKSYQIAREGALMTSAEISLLLKLRKKLKKCNSQDEGKTFND